MSGSNNLPVGIDASAAFADLDRQVANLGRTFAAQAAPVASLNSALGQTSERLGQIERGTQTAQRAVGELRGALELLGAGGIAGPLGQVAQTMGRLSDAVATASNVAGRFGTALELLGRIAAPLAATVALVSTAALGLGVAYQAVAQRTEEACKAEQAYADALKTSNEFLGRYVQTAEQAWQARRQETISRLENARAIEIENLARANEAANRVGGVRARLEEAAAQGRASPEQVAAGIARAQATAVGIATIGGQVSDRIADLEQRLGDVRATIYSTPAGPDAPGGRAAGGGGAELDISAMVQRNVQRAAEEDLRARQRANDLIARDEERLLQRREQQNERTTDAIVNYAGDRFADLFSATEGGWQRLWSSMRQTALATVARIAAEAIIRPVIAPVVSSLGLGGLTGGDGAGGGGGALSGIANLLGLRNLIPSSWMDSLGLGGGVSGLLSTPLWGSSTAAAGMFAEASAASMGLSGNAAASLAGLGPTLGGLLGAAGLGAAGGGLLASFTGGNPIGGSVGGGLGAAAGLALAPFLGPLAPFAPFIGGALGGGLGGLFGNSGKGFSGGDALIGRTNDGFLTVTGYAGKGMDGGELTAEAQRQVEAINAQLRAANIRVSSGMRANMGGGGSPNPTTALGAIQQFGFGFSSDNARINQAIQPFGSNLEGALGVAQWITALDALTAALDTGIQPIRQITAQFEAAFENARKYGIGLEEVTRAQNAALGNLIAPTFSGLADTLAAERVGPNSPLNPRARAAAAQAEVSQLASRARNGDLTAYGRLQSATQTALAVNREVFGGGAAGVAGFNSILDKIEELIGGGAEALTAALFSAEIRGQTDSLTTELRRVAAEVSALRADMGQMNRTPDRLR